MRRKKILKMWRMILPNTEVFASTGPNVYLPCPLAPWTHEKAGTDNHVSFSVKSTTGRSVCACWACEFKGTLLGLAYRLHELSGCHQNVIDFVRNNDEGGIDDIIEELEEETFMANPKPKDESQLEEFCDSEKIRILFTEEEIEKWDLLYDPVKDAIVFPVRGFDGLLYGATGRPFGGKYYNYWRFHKSKFMFGEHLHNSGRVAIVEGPRDCIALSHVIPAVALGGWKCSVHQLNKIKELYDEVVLFLDNDKAGEKGTKFLIQSLIDVVPLSVAYYGSRPEKDPAEISGDLAKVPIVRVTKCTQNLTDLAMTTDQSETFTSGPTLVSS